MAPAAMDPHAQRPFRDAETRGHLLVAHPVIDHAPQRTAARRRRLEHHTHRRPGLLLERQIEGGGIGRRCVGWLSVAGQGRTAAKPPPRVDAGEAGDASDVPLEAGLTPEAAEAQLAEHLDPRLLHGVFPLETELAAEGPCGEGEPAIDAAHGVGLAADVPLERRSVLVMHERRPILTRRLGVTFAAPEAWPAR